MCAGDTSVLEKSEIQAIYDTLQYFTGIEGKSNDINRWARDPESLSKPLPSSFGTPSQI